MPKKRPTWLKSSGKSRHRTARPGLYPEHDLFIQLMKLKNMMRWMMGEEPITHLGHEYYAITPKRS